MSPSDPADLSDAELISRVRGGDVEAYGSLFARHREAATRLARSLAPGPDSDDLVSDAFAKVLSVLRGGGGPDVAFRPYLLTSVRRCHIDRIRSQTRTRPTDDLTVLDRGEEFDDPAVAGFESAAAARAYKSLPERWQMVLWHLDVEGQKPGDIAPMLGMSANSVSALAYRAREGLRQAFLQMHAADVLDDECRRTRDLLGAYVRQGLSRRDNRRAAEHLEHCRRCTALYLELVEVNSSLAAVVGPLVLGSATAAYLAVGTTAGGAGALAGVGLLLGRVRDVLVANAQTALAAGAAVGIAAAATVGLLVAAHHGGTTDSRPPTAMGPPVGGTGGQPAQHRNGRHTGHPPAPAAHVPVPSAAATLLGLPTATPTAASRPGRPSSTSGPPTSGPGSSSPGVSPPAAPPSQAGPGSAVGLSASVIRTSGSPLGTRVVVGVHVKGLPPGGAATVTLRLPPGATVVSASGQCHGIGLVEVCTVDHENPDLIATLRALRLLGLHLHLDPVAGLPTGTTDLVLSLLH
ncbi:sigma-70 family RNA polymerase sigma factor [Nocardioides terrisoli]|uniref:sigma-70 family RNA polymerase sigma factor n=1 Tax=Nocardioides terrisoli TaxID=3388267 RepID=UPI00287B7F2E|nr:sigma-70 family RNA polymerase sigma factor [Nocardioides marmorisolisilvae]